MSQGRIAEAETRRGCRHTRVDFMGMDAALHFAQQLVENRGWVSDEDLDRVRRVGHGDAEIAEIVAIVAWKTFANYFNHVAGTDVDFPAAAELATT